LNPLCENSPKSLIKIANKPILAYQLEFLERKEIKQVTVITQRKYYQEISNYLENEYRG
jgi:NDP-sugar pyrophosphorylase family protein